MSDDELKPAATGPEGFGCWYCDGSRCPCTCETDCGARAADHGHVCPQAPADVRAKWLRGTGLYGEEEIARITSADDRA